MPNRPRTPKQPTQDDQRSQAETERIRESTLKRMLNTQPKRHDEMIADRKDRKERQAIAAKKREGNK